MRRGNAWAAWAGKGTGKAAAAVAIVVLMLMMGLAPLVSSGDGSAQSAEPKTGHAILKMQEQGLVIDTGAGYDIPKEWQNPSTELRIVQFTGSAEGNWPTGVEKSAGRILHSIGDTAVVVRANARQESELRALDYVQWVGPYEPRFKVFANLLDMTGDIQITAFACPDVETARMIRELESLGAWDAEDTHFGAVNCRIQSGKLPYVARLDSVLLIQHLPEMKTLCSASGRVVDVHDLWVNTVSNLPQNIMGQGQIVHVQDTGIDSTHRDFTSGPLGNRIGYAESTTDVGYHGTFMTGVIAGNGYDMETYLGLSTTNRIYNELAATNPAGYPDRMGFVGRAPEATIYSRAGLTSAEWSAGYTYGARIFSNSWGPALLNPYYSAGADAFMLASPGALVLFAAGGGGPGTRTVSGEGNGKLVVSVGACENIRPLQGENSDNPNQILVSSARGPVDDGRVKPDVVEAGGNIYSTLSDDSAVYNQGLELYDTISPINSDSSDSLGEYLMLSGTSVAVAAASGDTALIRDYLVDVKGIASPHANLMKTLLIHGAEDIGYGYPSFDQGWGRVNVRNSVCPPAPNVLQWYHHDTGIASGIWGARTDGSMTTWVIDDSVPLKVTMSHWDASGSGVLTYDLDLKVTSPSGQVFWGNAFKDAWSTPLETQSDWSECAFPSWMGGAAYDWDTANDGGDDINNVEMFRVERPEKGQWSVQVVWKSSTARPFTVAMTGGFNASADVNAATNQYKVSLEMDRPRVVPERDDFGEAVFTCAPGGSIIVPYWVNNGGTSDNQTHAYILSAPLLPSGFAVSLYSPSNYIEVSAGLRVHGYATITVGTGVAAGTYTVALKALSLDDPTAPIAQSQIKFQIDVQTAETPPTVKIANSQMHEDAPSMVSWSSGGNDYIACAYRKEVQFGQRVYFTLSSDGGRTWSEPLPISVPSWQPGFVGITRATSGTYVGRLAIAYNAWNPGGYGGSTSDLRSGYVKVAYADAPYTSWTTVNALALGEGAAGTYNSYRTVNIVWHAPTNSFMLVAEFFSYDSSDLNIGLLTGVYVGAKTSTDGGAIWSALTSISPISTGINCYLPHAAVDVQGHIAIWFHERDSGDASQDRDLVFRYYNGAWGTYKSAWDTTDNVMFAQGVSAPQGVNRNRNYCTVIKGANSDGDRQLYQVWTDNAGTSFTTNNGPYGPIISDQDYGTRFLMDGEYTDDGYVWWTAMRHFKYDIYAQPNIFTVRDNDYTTAPAPTVDYLTLNSYQKGKQRTVNLTEGSGKLLVAWDQMGSDADTDVCAALMSNGWQSEADTLGPAVEDIAVDHTVCAPGTLLNLAANFNDWPTGGNNILDAQYSVDYGATTVQMWESDGTFDTPAEAAYAPSQIDTTGWIGGWHSIWVRGQDNQGNWGEWAEILVFITGPSAPEPPTDPDPADGATDVPLSQEFSVYYSDPEGDPGTIRFYWKDNPTPFATRVAGSGTRAVTASIVLASKASYEWYVTAQDSTGTTRGPSIGYWSFSTVDETPPAHPTDLDVSYFGPSIIPTTETRYLRADGVLGTSQSATVTNGATLGNNVNIYAGIRVWKRDTIGTEIEITSGTAVAQVSRTAMGSGLLTNTWACPGATLSPTDSIIVRVYQATTANPTILTGTWSTGQLGATQLDAATWSVTLWLTRGTTTTASRVIWGTNTYNCKIANFGWNTACVPGDHNTLNWTLSADDGAGANDVMCYNIYRADNPGGPWTPSNMLAVVPSGTETYCDMFAGMADATVWWYVVRANDTSYNEEQNENAVPETLPGAPYNIDLAGRAAGTWVFLSFPIEVTSNSIESILNDAVWGDGQTDWDVAKAWDNVNKIWLSYRKAGTANTLSNLDNKMGFWLHLTANGGDQKLSICPGEMPSGPVDIPLYAGWNMVGYPSLVGRTVGTALWGTTADHVDVFTTVYPYITPANSNYVMTPNCGYWVRVTSDSVWRIEDAPAAPYLEVTKTAPATASPGDNIVYTITCTNIGDATAYDVVVTEIYPVGTTFVASIPAPTIPGNIWVIGTLAPSQSYVITVTMAVDPGASGTLINFVEAQYEDGLGIPQPPVYDSALTTLTDAFMLLTKTGPATANPGEIITYTLTYQNIGTAIADNVVITEIYPMAAGFLSAMPAPSVFNNVWNIGSVPAGASGSITIDVILSIGASGILVNSAYLDYDLGRVWANCTTVIVNPDILFSKAAPATANPGDSIDYTLTYQNIGTDWAYNVTITEYYPVETTFVSATPPADLGNNVWHLGAVAPGATGSVMITVMLSAGLTEGTVVTNNASLDYRNAADWVFQEWAYASTLIQVDSRPVRNLDTGEGFWAIQSAIDDLDTQDGHSIEALAGLYFENIIIYKSLKINGVGANESIIIGNLSTNPAVTILSAGSSFSNFTVMNCDMSPSHIGILVRANNVTVTDNIICQNSNGLTIGNTGSFTSLMDSTADFNSGSKGVFNENYAVESVSDNPSLPDGSISLASLYGDSFNCPSSDAGTWKWLNADDKVWGNGVHSIQTKNINVTQSGKGYMALNSVTAQDDLGLMGPAMIDSVNDWDMQLDFNKIYSENNNQWLFGLYFVKNWNGSGVMNGDNFRLLYYAYDGGMRFYADMTVGGISQGSNYIGTTATSGTLRVRYDTDVNTLYFYYWNSNAWAQLWSKTYNIDSWDLRFLIPLASYVTLPDIRMSFDNFKFTGSFVSAPYMPSGNWTSEALPMSQAYLMTNCTLTYTNASPQNYVDRIEWIVNGSVVAIYDQDIIGGNVLDIRDSDLTVGSFSSINSNYRIKLYLVGNGNGSILIDSIFHYAYQVSNYWGNVIARNDVMNNGIGIEVLSSGSGSIHANRFIDNTIQAADLEGDCSWDAGYPDGGNTWSDYFGADLYSGPLQNIPGSDGIGDTPYFFEGSQDNYPLMEVAGAAPHVVVSKIASMIFVMPRQFVNYTIFFNNTGNAWANQIWLNDTLPAGVSFVMASIPPTYVNGQDIGWMFENVPVGNHSLTVMVQVNVGVPKTTLLSNMAVCEYSPNGATTMDWANSTVNWMLSPYVIYGYVRDNFGLPLVGTTVNILNNDTGESIIVLTNALGQYSAEMGSLPSGYMNGDALILTTADPSGGYNATVINALLFGEQVDIMVTVTDITAPTHSGESPSNGGTSANATPVISVDVTDLQAGVNVTTVRLYVMGFNVLCDIEAIENGYRITYWHEAGFASGTVISCRIVARDFAGNLMDWTWSFTVP